LLPRGRCASRAALPRLEVAVLVTAIVASGEIIVSTGTGFEALLGLALAVDRSSSTKFAHKRVVVIVSCVSATDSGSSRSAVESTSVVVAPVCAALTIGTVTSHVACVTADTADDASSEVLCLRAVVLAMSDLATVLASLVFVVTQGTVESSKLTELVALELVLTFGDRGSRLNDVVNQLLCLVDFVLCVGHDQAMEVFFLVAGMGSVRTSLPFLYRAFATDGNLGTGLRFHLLEGVATRTDE